MTLTSKQIQNLLIALIFIYPLLFIWQGGELQDIGFYSTHYQSFLENLKTGQLDSLLFLTNILGALWLKLFPGLGILGLSFFYLLVLYFNVYLTYLILQRLTNKKTLLLFALLCGVIVSERLTMFVFNYDLMSWFFLLYTGYFLIKAIETQNLRSIFLSGMFLALASLSRFPAIVFLGLLPIILGYKLFYKKTLLKTQVMFYLVKYYALFVIGFLSLLALFFGILSVFSLTETFISNLGIVGKLSQNESSYNTLYLLEDYIREVIVFIPHAFILASLMLSTSLIYSYSKKANNYWPWFIFLILVGGVAFSVYGSFAHDSYIKYLIPAFCLSPLVMSIIDNDKYSLTALVLTLLAVSQVVGTNTSFFFKLDKALLALLPLAIIIIGNQKNIYFQNIRINSEVILKVGLSIVLIFSIGSRIGWVYHVEEGLFARFKTTFPIEHIKMKGIYSTNKRALHIKTLSASIDKHLTNDNTLFIFGYQPIFYYLNNQQPPIKSFWLNNKVLKTDELFNSINESIKSTGKWPLIVDTKEKSMGQTGEQRLAEFLKKNNYVKVEQNNNFEIWKKFE